MQHSTLTFNYVVLQKCTWPTFFLVMGLMKQKLMGNTAKFNKDISSAIQNKKKDKEEIEKLTVTQPNLFHLEGHCKASGTLMANAQI